MTTEIAAAASPWPGAGALGDAAFKNAISAFKRMPTIYFGGFCLFLGMDFFHEFLTGKLNPPDSRWLHDLLIAQAGPALSLLFMTIWLLKLPVEAWIAVSVHRFILLQETTSGFRPFGHRYAWTFTLWLLVFGILYAVFEIGMPPLLVVALGIAIIVVDLRLSLLFPAVAIGAADGSIADRIRTSWRRTRGKAWTLFWAGIAAVLPFFFAILIIGFATFALPDALGQWCWLLISSVSAVAAPMCGAAVASLAYRAALDGESRHKATL